MAKRQFCPNCKGSYDSNNGYQGYCSETCYNEAEKSCKDCEYHHDDGTLTNPMPCAVNPNTTGTCLSFWRRGT